MKRKLLFAAAFLLSWSTINAQSALEAGQLSQTDIRGTARSMSMGGAMGALGGDITSIAINPAGIGVYQSSEIVTTLDFQNVENKSTSRFESIKENRFKVDFNNFAFVGTFPIYNDVAPLINFGFSYNKVKSFNKKYSMSGSSDWALTDYMADRANQINGGMYNGSNLGLPSDVAGRDDMWRNDDWMSILAYNSYLINYDKDADRFYPTTDGMGVQNALFVQEKGSVNKYDFNMGTTFADMLSVGLTVSVTDLDYRMYSMNSEDFRDDKLGAEGGFDLHNERKTEGSGWDLGLGVIFKPIHELRIGIAYQSPTWYNITDHYYAGVNHDFSQFRDKGHPEFPKKTTDDKGYVNGWVESFDGDMWARSEYKLRTPDRWTFSAAGVIGTSAIVSLDVELTDYSKMNYKNRNGRTRGYNDDFVGVNNDIKNDYKLATTIRLGGEYRFTKQFSGRVGYSWQQSPYSDDFKKFIDPTINKTEGFNTPGSVPHYVIQKDTNYFTWGVGYRFTKNIYTDLAFVYKTQKADLYTHSMAEKTKLKEESFQGALTLGFRF